MGYRRIYGCPGDGINGSFGVLQRAKEKIDFIQVRHEQMVAFIWRSRTDCPRYTETK
jgi:pyruvate dehydrogenase (quinone)